MWIVASTKLLYLDCNMWGLHVLRSTMTPEIAPAHSAQMFELILQ
jgi:hypothetical protein